MWGHFRLPLRILGLRLLLLFCLAASVPLPVQAAARPLSEEVALFYDALASLGEWLEYKTYGLVWRPTGVDREWRPYTNGRWVLTEEGYVFETDEPWGWATYHYGNWLQTAEYGWIWVPGRTWYPHTVTWRANDDYVGWTPVPPPDTSDLTETEQADAYRAAGADRDYADYSPGSRLSSWLASPLSWIFVPSSSFLLGWGQPYAPGYSYWRSGVLVPVAYYPVIYERTVYITNYVIPDYARRACYNWGPPPAYLVRVYKLKPEELEHRRRRLEWRQLHQVLPPEHLRRQHPVWRSMTVPVAAGHRFHHEPVPDPRWVWGRLNHPKAAPSPPGLLKKGLPVPPGHLEKWRETHPGQSAVVPPSPAASRPRPPHPERWLPPDSPGADRERLRRASESRSWSRPVTPDSSAVPERRQGPPSRLETRPPTPPAPPPAGEPPSSSTGRPSWSARPEHRSFHRPASPPAPRGPIPQLGESESGQRLRREVPRPHPEFKPPRPQDSQVELLRLPRRRPEELSGRPHRPDRDSWRGAEQSARSRREPQPPAVLTPPSPPVMAAPAKPGPQPQAGVPDRSHSKAIGGRPEKKPWPTSP